MIVDKLENISMYRIIPDHVVEYIRTLEKDTLLGRCTLISGDYANVEEYQTKFLNDAKFEAHNNHIDIQILLKGREKIYYKPVCEMTEILTPYNNEKDIIFYNDKVEGSDFVTLDGANFMMIFPHEAHAPQVEADGLQNVTKVVVKVQTC